MAVTAIAEPPAQEEPWSMVFIRVGKGERTCLDCGETTAWDYCPRCSETDQGIYSRNLVDSLSYLRAGEYALVH